MDLNEEEEENVLPNDNKIGEKSVNQGKPKKTKEEIMNWSREYYAWLKSIYHVESFELKGREEEILFFYHGFNYKALKDENSLSYYLIDDEYAKYLAKREALHLQGEEIPENEKRVYESKGFINIDKDEKYFNFGIEWEHKGHGYGRTIYNNYLNILEMLGIENKEQYEVRVYGNPDHDFLKRIETERLFAKTNNEPNAENALQMIGEFAKYPNTMRFSELNSIIEYALNSGIPMEDITKAINDNGFNIGYSTVNSVPCFNDEDLKKFKLFNITGLKASSMHHHFMGKRNFGFMKLLGDVDTEDATLEFKRVFEEVKNEYEEREENKYIPENLKEFGELEHIILDWEYSGLLIKNVDTEIKSIVKKQAISKFDEFDPEHKHSWEFQIDYNSDATFSMLRDAGLMDRSVYIELYQKALNRNYNLEEFDSAIYRYIDKEERKEAKKEIAQNVYYPSPKRRWQESSASGKEHKVSKIKIPQRISEQGTVREIIKKEIIEQGIARSIKIKTDMTGIGKDGKHFVVDNLKDWLFGVPGAHGNLKVVGTNAVVLPPQTPEFAINLIKQVLNNLAYPGVGGRGD